MRKGQILVVSQQKQAGALVMDNGLRRLFHLDDWQGALPPTRGMAVDFVLDENLRPRQLRLAGTSAPALPASPA